MYDISKEKSITIGEIVSRLGREYLRVGYYTEIYFPQQGVRFIVVNDGVDSLYSETNDFTPMRNCFNEFYAKDSSKKVRIVKRAQTERGELLGGKPPYGYRRDEKVRKGIIPGEEAAGVVKRIFALCAEGKGPNQIARIQTKEQVLTPSNYYYQKTGASHASLDTKGRTIEAAPRFLDNKTYLGHMAGLCSTTLFYKNQSSFAIRNRSKFW